MPPFEVPVAFIVFNRPDTTARVFEEIRRIKPLKLLVVADGPRHDNPGDTEKCAVVRSIIEQVDWPCEVLKNYSETNLGCKLRVSSGLDWVFEQAEEAIILEDDCLPDHTFFLYCRELLCHYRNDENIMMICGTNLSDSSDDLEESYYLSRYPHIWGWASWKRVWRDYDVRMDMLDNLLKNKSFQDSFKTRREYDYWAKCFKAVSSGEVDTWDAQITYMAFRTSALSIFPKRNLITNIGFGMDATHTIGSSHLANLPSYSLGFPLQHISFMIVNQKTENERKRKEGIGFSQIIRTLCYLLRKIGFK